MTYTQPDSNTIEINGKHHKFSQEIREVLQLPDRIIIRLLVDDFEEGDPNVGRNVLAFNESGEELWRIEASGYFVERDPNVPEAYFGVDMTVGHLRVHGADFVYDLDPDTGAVSNAEIRYMGT